MIKNATNATKKIMLAELKKLKMQQSLCSKPYYLCHAFEQETILFNN